MCLRALVLLGVAPLPLMAADALAPVTVCEILADVPSHEGKEIAVLGRYSFRRDGRWIGEESCSMTPIGPATTTSAKTAPAITVSATATLNSLWLTEDADGGPKPPNNFELDASVLNRKFADLIKRTALGKFRFGTSDYDRWAVVYGRIVPRKREDGRKFAADLVFRGSGVVIFLTTEH